MEAICVILMLIMLLITVVLLTIVISMKSKLASLERRYNRFLRGKDVKNMEEIIVKRFSEMDLLKKSTKTVADALSGIDEMGKMSFQKMGLVKYDAFDDVGGNLSFALALLTKKNNGFILNSVHGKEGCYTYLKEIVNGESYIVLGAEEQKALEQAINTDNFME